MSSDLAAVTDAAVVCRPAEACAETTPPPGPTGVRDDLGWALVTIGRAYRRAAEGALAGLPGGARGYRLLFSVANDCPGSQLTLAHRVGLDRTVVTYLLDDLQAAGLLTRPLDPTDRRARRVVATEAGLAGLAAVRAALDEAECTLLAGLSDPEATVLRRLLQRVALGVDGATDTCNR